MQGVVPPEKLEGTLAYMAPEQTGRMNMSIDYRSDFYALGVTFYELLTATLPFQYSDPLEMLHAHLATPPPDPSHVKAFVPRSLGKLVQKLMAKDPSERYQSPIGIEVDLEKCARGESEPFPLGEGEIPDHLNLSQKIYGREKEAEALLKAYERASQGAFEIVMISGYSGIGKTKLIFEVHKPMVQHKGYFVSGKFDQLERTTPYTAITQALNQLVWLLLAEPQERFDKVKDALKRALGELGQVLVDLAPDFELILGPQAPLPKVSSEGGQNRMLIAFKNFLLAIATEEHPLVLFIDDLQWIDSGSLRLLDYMAMDVELHHILFLGAFRDNEVGSLHPLRAFLKKCTFQSLALAPLTKDHFNALLKDSFKREAEPARFFPLSKKSLLSLFT